MLRRNKRRNYWRDEYMELYQVPLFNLSHLSGRDTDNNAIAASALYRCHNKRVKKLAFLILEIELNGAHIFCAICQGACDSEGEHQASCLCCGHIFGKSCIKAWIKLHGCSIGCPICKERSTTNHIRSIFPTTIVVDAVEVQKLKNSEVEYPFIKGERDNWIKKEAVIAKSISKL